MRTILTVLCVLMTIVFCSVAYADTKTPRQRATDVVETVYMRQAYYVPRVFDGFRIEDDGDFVLRLRRGLRRSEMRVARRLLSATLLASGATTFRTRQVGREIRVIFRAR